MNANIVILIGFVWTIVYQLVESKVIPPVKGRIPIFLIRENIFKDQL